jgi:N-acyl-D-aspartate/D-glutamate deacylase
MAVEPIDLLLKGATFFDGLGSPGRQMDVAVHEGKIFKIATSLNIPARDVRVLNGSWLLPGLVDNHTHYDIEVEMTPGLPESVRHGITTLVMGNCSLSIMMGDPQDLADVFLRVENLPAPMIRSWLETACRWKSVREYFDHLGSLALGPRITALLGHSALRVAVMGLERSLKEKANENDLAKMKEAANEALDAGANGISIDMVHWHKVTGRFSGHSVPSHYAGVDEYRMLAELCRERDVVFSVIPDPSRPWCLLPPLFWSIGLFRAPLRLNILSALDVTHPRWLWRVFPLTTFIFNRLLGANIRFQTLTEPFKIYADGPLTPLFEEFAAGVELNSVATAKERSQLWTPAFRARFITDWNSGGIKSFHRDLTKIFVVDHPDTSYIGRSVREIGKSLRKTESETLEMFLDWLQDFDTKFRWYSVGANDRPRIREKLMSNPFILPGFTDAGAHSRNLAFFDGPLSLLRQAVQTGFIPIERAIQRVTSEPCQWFQVDGGVLREGARADFVVLNPEALKRPVPAPEDFADPMLQGGLRMVKRGSADLIRSVAISGCEVVRDGEPTAELGRVKTGCVLQPLVRLRDRQAVLARYRNRIDDFTLDHPLENYWDVFVFKHQDVKNITMHCLAVFLMYVVGMGLLLTQNPWWLLVGVLSQIVGLAGHLLFEDNHVDVRDFVFSWRASRCLNMMFWSVLRGKYGLEIQRVRSLFEREVA